MDRRERINDIQEAIRIAMDAVGYRTWVALPCTVVQVYEDFTADLVCTIMMQVRQQDGTWVNKPLPQLNKCPIHFPGGGIFLMTFPLQPGDEVLAIFADRCIDGWWQSGAANGPQAQLEFRKHDLSDGFCIPKVWSKPNAPPSGVPTKTARFGTIDGTCYVEIAPGGVINIVAPGGLNINGVTVGTGEGTFNGIKVSAHVHGGVQSGSSSTDPPTG